MQIISQRIADAVGGTGAATITLLQNVDARTVHLFRISTANYTGTVDIKGGFRNETTKENIPYVSRAVGTATFGTPSVAQLSYSGSTAVAMVLTMEPREELAVTIDAGGGNAGTITIDVVGVDDAASILLQDAGGVISGTVDQGTGGSSPWLVKIDQTTPGTTNQVTTTMQPLAGAIYGPTRDNDWGTVTAKNVKASAGNVYGIIVTNINASLRYIQIHNKATIPLATEVPVTSIPLPGGTAASPGFVILDSAFFAPSEYLSAGVGWAISTTIGTFTDSATASNHTVQTRYK